MARNVARERFEHLVKLENTLDAFIFRVKELCSLYTMYGIQYQGMDVTTRRFLALTGPTCDMRVRHMVYAKFLLAAILEWAPANHDFSMQAFIDHGRPVVESVDRNVDQDKGSTANELCPYWESFFAELHEARVLLEKVYAELHLAHDPALLPRLARLIETAEVKAGWCESLLKLVAGSTSGPGFVAPSNEADKYTLWNHFCLNVGRGVSVPDAAMCFGSRPNRLPKYPLPFPLCNANGGLIWFPFDMGSEQPWLAHAEAILQQPHHLVLPEPSSGVYAHEAQQWMLEKTSDTSVPHVDCRRYSPCCFRLHMHCTETSPCRIWGPSDCVHKRAGAQSCTSGHCKMVDWMKYNVCVSNAPDGSR